MAVTGSTVFNLVLNLYSTGYVKIHGALRSLLLRRRTIVLATRKS
jgi:hypothetical protein